MPERTVHEVLVAGRNVLANVGWKQANKRGRFTGGPGGCAFTAMYTATGGAVKTCNEATVVLARLLDPNFDSACVNWALYRWNDAPGRTKEEVLALFDKAIAATAPPPPEFDLKVPDHIAIVVEDIHARQ